MRLAAISVVLTIGRVRLLRSGHTLCRMGRENGDKGLCHSILGGVTSFKVENR